MSEVFIAKPGVLRDVDKKALRKAGIVVVEANHEDVKFIRAHIEVSGSDMFYAALEALNSQPSETNAGYVTSAARQREKFMSILSKIVKASKT